MSWLTDIRKVALLGFIASVLSLLLPLWNTARTMQTAATTVRDLWLLIPFAALGCLLAALEPAFFFTLYRNQGTIRVPDRLRLLARAAAFVFGIIVAESVVEWIQSSGPYLQSMGMLDWTVGAASVRAAQSDPRTVGQLSNFFGELSNLTVILLLIALHRQPEEESNSDAPLFEPLRVVTKAAVIVGALILAFCVIRLALSPYTYSVTRDYLLKIGRTPPPFSQMLTEAIRALLIAVCMFTAPYIIYRSNRAPTASADTDPSDIAPPAEHSPDSAPGT
jgi:hypothetical protein